MTQPPGPGLPPQARADVIAHVLQIKRLTYSAEDRHKLAARLFRERAAVLRRRRLMRRALAAAAVLVLGVLVTLAAHPREAPTAVPSASAPTHTAIPPSITEAAVYIARQRGRDADGPWQRTTLIAKRGNDSDYLCRITLLQRPAAPTQRSTSEHP